MKSMLTVAAIASMLYLFNPMQTAAQKTDNASDDRLTQICTNTRVSFDDSYHNSYHNTSGLLSLFIEEGLSIIISSNIGSTNVQSELRKYNYTLGYDAAEAFSQGILNLYIYRSIKSIIALTSEIPAATDMPFARYKTIDLDESRMIDDKTYRNRKHELLIQQAEERMKTSRSRTNHEKNPEVTHSDVFSEPPPYKDCYEWRDSELNMFNLNHRSFRIEYVPLNDDYLMIRQKLSTELGNSIIFVDGKKERKENASDSARIRLCYTVIKANDEQIDKNLNTAIALFDRELASSLNDPNIIRIDCEYHDLRYNRDIKIYSEGRLSQLSRVLVELSAKILSGINELENR